MTAGDDFNAFMKEDLFSSSSENLLSVADEKQLSIDNLNSQLDGYKTTNAPDSNDKQNVENMGIPSPKESNNCEPVGFTDRLTDQKKKSMNVYKILLGSST